MAYDVEPLPNDATQLAEYLRRQLERVAAELQMVPGVQLTPRFVAPAKPRNGMIVLADGTDWDPGAGEGFYGYYANDWHKLG